MLAVLIGVTGLVVRSLLVTWFRLSRSERPAIATIADMETRLRKVEAATSSMLVDLTGMREKERFMTRLQAGAAAREAAPRDMENELSPMVTQNIPTIPRTGFPR